MTSLIQRMHTWSDAFRATVRRFPLPLFVCLSIAILLLGLSYDTNISIGGDDIRFRFLVVLVYFFFLSLCAALLAQNFTRSLYKWLLFGFVCVDAVAYFYLLPNNLELQPAIHIVRWLLSLLVIISFSCIAPFLLGSYEKKEFWTWLWVLFLRLCLTVIFAWLLMLSLSLALGSLDLLLGISVQPEWFFRLWILIGTLFAPSFFLAGIPRADEKIEWPFHPVLRFFVLYIGLPVAGLYMIILYLYSTKILLLWEWPEGQVVWLIFAFLVVGIFVSMLSYPLHILEWKRYKKIHRFFFYAIFPIMCVYFGALFIRVQDYGWTDNRSLVAILGIWIVVSSALYLYKKLDLRIFFAVFSVLLYVSIWFPGYNLFQFGIASQKERLMEEFASKGMIDEEGMIMPPTWDNAFSRSAYDILSYLQARWALDDIVDQMGVPLEESVDGSDWYLEDQIIRALGLELVDMLESEDWGEYHYLWFEEFVGLEQDISEYSSVIYIDSWLSQESQTTYTYDRDTGILSFSNTWDMIEMFPIASEIFALNEPEVVYAYGDRLFVFQSLNGYQDVSGKWDYLDFRVVIYTK